MADAETKVVHKPIRAIKAETYQLAWEAYRTDPHVNTVQKAAHVARSTAQRLVEEGVPALGLPPLRMKLQAALKLVTQLDVEESAKSLAIGRSAIRTGVLKFAQAMQALRPADIPKALIVPQLATLVTLDRKLAAIDRGEEHPDFTTEDAADTMSQLLTVIASRRLPGGARLVESRVTVAMSEDGTEARMVDLATAEDLNGTDGNSGSEGT